MAPEVAAGWIGAGAVFVSAVFSTFIALWVRAQQSKTDEALNETQRAISSSAQETQRAVARLEQETQLAVSATSRETELVVTALGHLGGGSQERAAGLAALRALKSLTGTRWPDYSPVVGQLLYTQLLFVLTQGRNRWEAHEVANLMCMSTWIDSDATLGFDANMRLRVQQEMKTYVDDWEHGEPGGKRNERAVNEFIRAIREKWSS